MITKENNSYIEHSSGALTSSAVGALFSFREADDEEIRLDETDVDNSEVSNKRNDKGNEYNAFRNLNPRPSYLPSLIDTLIGVVDEYGDQSQTGSYSNAKARSILREVKHGYNSNIGDRSIRENRDIQGNDDTVAIAAAAAAAAVLSDSAGKRGRLRMKAFNDEWEEALRWIASWGEKQQEMGHLGDKVQNTNEERKQSKRSGNESRKQRRNTRQREGGVNPVGVESNRDFNRCIDKCLGNHRSSEKFDTTEDHLVSKSTLKRSNIFHSNALFSVKLIKSWLTKDSNQLYSRILSGVVGVILSTSILCGVQHVISWWKFIKCSSSVKLLLAEEGSQAKNYKCRQTQLCKSSGKKNVSKKMRQKSKIHREFINPEDILKNDDLSNLAELNEKSWVKPNDNYSLSDQVFEHTFFQDVDCKRKQSADTIGGNISRTNTSTTSSLTDDQLEKNSVLNFKQKKTGSSIKPIDVTCTGVPSPKKIEVEIRSKERMPKIDSSKKHSSTSSQNVAVKHMSNKLNASFSPVTVNGKFHTKILNKNQPVPTEKQREEASKKLRQFQQEQIQKIIIQRQSNAKLLQSTKSNHVQVVSQFNVSPLLSTSSVCSSSVGTNITATIGPTRALPDVTLDEDKNCVDDENESLCDFLSTGRLILSDMLDESDEDSVVYDQRNYDDAEYENKNNIIIDKWKRDLTGHLDARLETKEIPLKPSIALGDLLTGKCSGAAMKSTNISSSVASWDRASLRLVSAQNDSEAKKIWASTVEEESYDNPMDCADANVSLKVSAKSFSPSWNGVQASTVSHQERIW